MAALWIVHRDARLREALRRLLAAGPDAVMGSPEELRLEGLPPAELVVLGLAGDFEAELEFAHRAAARLPDAAWILLAERADLDEARRLFDALPAEVLPFPVDGAALRRRARAARLRRSADTLSRRLARDAVAARFARWFADLELPQVLRALDPRLAAVPVLLRGEPGSGRGLLGAYLHAFGGTAGGELVRVACPDLDAPALLAEIARGARREAARRALSVLLEDVEGLPASAQRQLRAWVEGGLPEGVPRTPRLRWIASCGEDAAGELPPALDPGLAQALGGLEVRIPPLRERPAAVERLARDAALAWCTAHGEAPRRFAPDAVAALRAHPWPGNLRELEGVVTRSLAAGCGDPIRAADLRFEGGAAAAPLAPAEAEPDLEVELEPEEPPAAAAEAAAAASPLALADAPLRRLIGAVAHEVRNPLVAIRTFCQLLPERFEDPEFRERFAGIVGGDVRRIEGVLEQLDRFAELGPPERKPVDVAALLDELLEERREEIQARRLVVLKELDRQRPYALGDPAQLRFAFEALVGKALALVPERGDVYLASRHHPDGLRGGPAVRVLLRFQSPAEILPSGGPEGVSLAETTLEMVMAEAVVRSQGGTTTATPSTAREGVIVLDLPAPP